MAVDKLGWATENDPGAITHDLVLILKESGIMPVITVDEMDITKVTRSLQLLSVMGKARDKD